MSLTREEEKTSSEEFTPVDVKAALLHFFSLQTIPLPQHLQLPSDYHAYYTKIKELINRAENPVILLAVFNLRSRRFKGKAEDLSVGLNSLLSLSEQGNADAKYLLAQLYKDAYGGGRAAIQVVSKDIKKADTLMREAAQLGQPHAAFYLAKNRYGHSRDEEFRSELLRLAQQDTSQSVINMVEPTFFRWPVECQAAYELAIMQLGWSASSPSVKDQAYILHYYEQGARSASPHYAEPRLVSACMQIGHLYAKSKYSGMNRWAVPQKDFSRALGWYQKVPPKESGFFQAELYAEGEGEFLKDNATAAKLYRSAIEYFSDYTFMSASHLINLYKQIKSSNIPAEQQIAHPDFFAITYHFCLGLYFALSSNDSYEIDKPLVEEVEKEFKRLAQASPEKLCELIESEKELNPQDPFRNYTLIRNLVEPKGWTALNLYISQFLAEIKISPALPSALLNIIFSYSIIPEYKALAEHKISPEKEVKAPLVTRYLMWNEKRQASQSHQDDPPQSRPHVRPRNSRSCLLM